MKKSIVVLSAVVLAAAFGVNVLMRPKPAVCDPTMATAVAAPAAKLDELERRISFLDEELEETIHSSPALTLARIDRCIDARENNVVAAVSCGSFSDWIVPELADARKAGASKSDVAARLDRLLRLAKAGNYYSSSLDTNTREVEGYIARVKKMIN